MDEIPNPGSDEALAQGCTCPVLDNAHGKGYFGGPDGTFVMNAECPLHGAEAMPQVHNVDSAAR